MAESSISVTEMDLFNTSPGSTVEKEEEHNPKDQSPKKSRGAPTERVRLSQQEKIELVQYHLANPERHQKALIEWCFAKFEMRKRLSVGAMCNLLLIMSSASRRSMKMKSTLMC